MPRGPKPNKAVAELFKSLFEFGLEQTGMYYSVYRGIVADNDDPENLQRLKLIIPQISGNQQYEYWAFPVGVFYGKGYGIQILPKKGDVVWVMFEGGRPEIPIWQHGHPARKELPNDDEVSDKDCYWFVTPKLFKVKFNDTKKTITIETPFGSKIHFNDQGVSIINGNTSNISLGKLNRSTYSALLGEKTKEVLEDMGDFISKLHEAFEKDLGQLAAAGLTNTVAFVPLIKTKVEGLQGKINQILSQLNSLE